MPGGGHFKGIKTECDAVFFHNGQRTAFRCGSGFGKKLEQGVHVRLAGNVHGQMVNLLEQMFLQGGIDDMRVIAVAQKSFANGYGVFKRLLHRDLLANNDGNGLYYAFWGQ